MVATSPFSVLVDTFNLKLEHGSGIKTYGQSLLAALQMMNADIHLLGDRPLVSSGSPLLDEVLFFDSSATAPAIRLPRLREVLAQAKWLVKGPTARQIRPKAVVRELSPFGKSTGLLYDGISNVNKIFDRANKHFYAFGRPVSVTLPEPVDIWHATTPLPIRVRGAKMITTIHDLIPLRLPYATLDNKRFFYKLVKRALKDSDLILTVSECSKRDILELFDWVPEDRIRVTYQSLPPPVEHVDQPLIEAVLKSHRLESGKYLLFAGNIEPKKNLLPLIKAVTTIASDMPLVVVGSKAWLWEKAVRAGKLYLGQRFRLLNFLPRDELSALYRHAGCMLFPSVYEGFGLPPLEAMQHDCPVVCSNAASLPEVCGDAALYFDPNSPTEIRQQVQRVLASPKLRDQLIRAGRERVDYFSLPNYAARLQSAYESLGQR